MRPLAAMITLILATAPGIARGGPGPVPFAIEMIDTPFTAPRRMRFDAKGRLWIPGFSSGVLARFDPETREFREYEPPEAPR